MLFKVLKWCICIGMTSSSIPFLCLSCPSSFAIINVIILSLYIFLFGICPSSLLPCSLLLFPTAPLSSFLHSSLPSGKYVYHSFLPCQCRCERTYFWFVSFVWSLLSGPLHQRDHVLLLYWTHQEVCVGSVQSSQVIFLMHFVQKCSI